MYTSYSGTALSRHAMDVRMHDLYACVCAAEAGGSNRSAPPGEFAMSAALMEDDAADGAVASAADSARPRASVSSHTRNAPNRMAQVLAEAAEKMVAGRSGARMPSLDALLAGTGSVGRAAVKTSSGIAGCTWQHWHCQSGVLCASKELNGACTKQRLPQRQACACASA